MAGGQTVLLGVAKERTCEYILAALLLNLNG
jgi:hypothetical protein